MSLLGLIQLARYIIAGLDQRYGWTGGLPVAVQLAALTLCILGYALVVWATASNTFFSQIVRIQSERGHAVATGGPYHTVRHPAYAGAILYELAVPVLLASWPALIVSGLSVVLLILRTALEDRTLQAELIGYADYARQVRYRLAAGHLVRLEAGCWSWGVLLRRRLTMFEEASPALSGVPATMLMTLYIFRLGEAAGEKTFGRQPMTDRRVFLAGLAAGALGGLLVRRRMDRPRWMPHLDISRRVLAETRGEVRAALLAARVQARYDELVARGPRFDHPALRRHLEASILPGLALYRELREENGDREAVLTEIDRLFTAWVEHSDQRKRMRLLGRLPDPFAILRIGNRLVLKTGFPPEGWRLEWLEDSDRCVAYDIHECFYLNVLTAYGAPELTAHYCQGDDLLYGSLPGVSWERTKTLGRGDDRCNFRFCRVDAAGAFATPQSDVLAMYVRPDCTGRLEPTEDAPH